jgi:hypothetical protein
MLTIAQENSVSKRGKTIASLTKSLPLPSITTTYLMRLFGKYCEDTILNLHGVRIGGMAFLAEFLKAA